jgi:uncharacterized protein
MKAIGSRLLSQALVALALVLCALGVLAQPAAPPAPTNFFTDTAGVVPADAAARIEERLREFEKASSNQVLVVVADRIPAGYASLEEYTNRTAQAWRVGDKSRDNGAVLFVFVGDRKVRIEVGYGLEGALPDALASRIINDEITPRFRAGRYDEGVLAGVNAIIRATRGEYRPAASYQPAPSYQPPDPMVAFAIRAVGILAFGLFILFFIVGPFVLVFFVVVVVARGSRTYTGGGSSRSKFFDDWRSSGGGRSGGGSSWGGGSSGSSGGGGGGGFSGGGGSFGGGGASGSW